MPGRLGCGDLAAFITAQRGAPRLCQLVDASEISWNRRMDGISDAHVIVPTNGSTDPGCCDCLPDIEPWCHELHIFRNGVFVWGGPVVNVTYGYDQVTIDAKDVLAWTEYRVASGVIDYHDVAADISTIALNILTVAFAEHDPAVLQFIQRFDTTLTDQKLEVFRCFSQTSFEQLSSLADIGLNFTVLGRSIILGGEILPFRALGVLTDEMIMGDISVTKNGSLAGNTFWVHYPDSDDVPECAAHGVDITTGTPCSCPALSQGPQECYGSLVHLRDDSLAADYASAKALGDSLLAASRVVPRTIEFGGNTRVSPETPWDINDMVPGQRIDVSLTGLCLPVFQAFRLLEMECTQTGSDEEQISVTLGSIAGQD